jgi:hypothetical protein
MDFLDPKKQRAHAIRIWIGYVLIGLALLLGTIILLYQANGFRITREGQVIQNGLVFMSSQPGGAEIYANGEPLDQTTSARLSLPAGQYTFELKRDGYRDWKRGIAVEGGSVQRFEYPFLIPVDLRTDSLKRYEQQGLMTQSPDRRWLLVQTAPNAFDMFDLNSDEPAPAPRTVPAEVLSANSTTTGWQTVEWADNNRHVVLKRLFTQDGENSSEYILFDREAPAESRNLTTLLGFNPAILSLRDGDFDQYYALDSSNDVLFTASLAAPTPQLHVRDVLAFEADGPDSLIYATNDDAPDGETHIRLRQGDTSHLLREVPRDSRYLLALATYDGSLIAAAGAQKEGRVYVYQNPLDNISNDRIAVPVQILKVGGPQQIAFSDNSRFVMIASGADFAVYDAETDRGYAYQIDIAEGANAGAAEWMGGHHLTVVIGENVHLFDFDGTNQQMLVPAKPGYAPAFNPALTFLYVMSPEGELTGTSLRTPADE